ncbi:MAG TPA: tetratricopeptide repeat protein, partial [Vicinamibacteria bacterium]
MKPPARPLAGTWRGASARAAALVLVFSAQAARAGQDVPAVDVVFGGAADFALDVKAARRHLLALEAGQLLQVEVRENGPRVALALRDDKGTVLARREAPADTLTSLRLLAVAPTSGAYVLEARSDGEGRPGTYQVRVEEPRAATDADRALAAADDALADGIRLLNDGTGESRRQALVRLESAAAGFLTAGDARGQAVALVMRGRAQFDAGQPEALETLEKARGRFKTAGDREGEAHAVLELSWIRFRTGEFEAARAHLEEAAAMARALHSPRLLSAAVSGIGVVFDRTGEAERAVERYTEALALSTEAGSSRGQARALNNLGNAYKALGERERAFESYERALAVSRTTGRRDHRAMTLGNMATLQMDLGDDPRAFALLEEALSLARAAEVPDVEARTLNNMAKVLSRRGEHERAIALGLRSLELRRQMHDRAAEAATLHTLGRNLHRFGDTQAGLQRLGESLAIHQAIGQRYSEAETLVAIAGIERDRGNLREALARAEAAVALTEKLRSAVTSPELRASYVAAEQDTYGLYIDLLMRLHEEEAEAGHDAAALQTSERARARVLLEALVEARADIRQGVDPALLERERSLQKRLSGSTARLSRVLAREGPAEEQALARRELEEASQAHAQLLARMRQESPRYAALTQPVPATVEQVRRDLLDEETVLLEFYLAKERSFLWAVTPSSLLSHALPGQAPIEDAARTVHRLLTERRHARSPALLAEADRRLAAESSALSRLLLGGIAPRLATDWKGKRLLVVASGALAYVPFGALPSPVEGADLPLLRDHEIVFAPSASVLLALRKEGAAPGLPSSTTVAVVADPVFESADPRVAGRRGAPAQPAP